MSFWYSVWRMAALLVATASAVSTASVVVRLEPAAIVAQVGETFTIDVLADFGSEMVIGWGLDIGFDPSFVSPVGSPQVGDFWIPGYAPDGDGLTGSVDAFGDPDGDGHFGSVSGNGVLLASLTFIADAPGSFDVTPAYTAQDLNEGFPLDPSGFAPMSATHAHITIVPEPAMAILLIVYTAMCFCPRPRRGRLSPQLSVDAPRK